MTRTVRRLGGWTVRATVRVFAAVLLTVYPSNRLASQVGHDPGSSPYRDILKGAAWVGTFGYLGGSRGSVGVGLSNGFTGGIRYEVPFGAIGASLGIGYGLTSRFVVNPYNAATARTTGPFDNNVVLVDAGLQLTLTGRKTWRGFAPYLGGALGVAISGASPRDTSGYKFGTKITLAPDVGVRWYPARRFSVRGDFRLLLWKLSYPVQYKAPNQFDNTTVLPPSASLTEWTAHPWATIGLGWIF
ncbi:MAG TPA: hypothetical protein VGV12_14935 [Gemmatimonadales bacterium]|nr:hypothetical protein [Gemmatimonadales bacterium]